MPSSPAVRSLLVTLSCEQGGNVGPHGLASIGFPNGVAVVPQPLAAGVLLGKWDLMQETKA